MLSRTATASVASIASARRRAESALEGGTRRGSVARTHTYRPSALREGAAQEMRSLSRKGEAKMHTCLISVFISALAKRARSDTGF